MYTADIVILSSKQVSSMYLRKKLGAKKKSEKHMQSFVNFFTETIAGRSMSDERSEELRRLGLKLRLSRRG